MVQSKIRITGVAMLAAFGLSACSINVSEERTHWKNKEQAEKAVCEMVDWEALNDPKDCEKYVKD